MGTVWALSGGLGEPAAPGSHLILGMGTGGTGNEEEAAGSGGQQELPLQERAPRTSNSPQCHPKVATRAEGHPSLASTLQAPAPQGIVGKSSARPPLSGPSSGGSLLPWGHSFSSAAHGCVCCRGEARSLTCATPPEPPERAPGGPE